MDRAVKTERGWWDGAPSGAHVGRGGAGGARAVARAGRRAARARWPVVVAGLVAVTLAGPPAAAQQMEPPTIYVIATGGTISNVEEGDRLTGEEILRSVPGVDSVARFEVEQYSNVPSGYITPEDWHALSNRINELYETRSDIAGVIVTHGTDTMEETAYFLDRTVLDDRPVIVTGAMRNPSLISHDGPANFYNSARTIVHPGSRGRGAMIVLNDEILPARQATKTNTVRRNAFEAPGAGRLGVADPDTIYFYDERADPRPRPFDVRDVETLPRVDVIYTYGGADGTLMDAAMEAGARGLVLASVGRGGRTRGQGDATDRAVARGVFVVTSSRTMSGRVPVGDVEDRLEDWEEGEGIRFGAADLTPQKARILLILGLVETDDPVALMDVFRTRR